MGPLERQRDRHYMVYAVSGLAMLRMQMLIYSDNIHKSKKILWTTDQLKFDRLAVEILVLVYSL